MAVVNAVSARLAGVLAGAGPPVAVLGAWRDAVMNHPVLAVVLLVGYEALVAVLLFAGKIAADVRERWRPRIVDRVDREMKQRLSRFDESYREFMLGSLRFIDLKGLATVGFYTPELDEVFVDVSLASQEPNQASAALLATLPSEVTDRHSIRDFLNRERPVVLAVTGAPGSGKTTLLRHTARQLCRTHRDERRTIPILLYLRDHVTAIASTPDAALPELVRGTLGRYGPDEPDDWFERRLNDGDCLVLLDGLDEVARQEDRRGVASWVERQIRQYPRNDYVITSRPHGYLTARIDGAAVLHVCSFTDEQVSRFVHGWYLAIERHSTGATGEDIRLRAKWEADNLLRRLNGAPALYDLTVNPLLLTMIANVHRYRGALPSSRADLYREICQVMLWRRQEAKELPVEPNGDKKEALLGGLAFAMMQRKVRDLPRADVLAEIDPALRRISRKLTAEEFLTDIASNGLLIERESGLYSFAHQTFQEYLTATHIRDKGLTKVLVDAVDDVWWREPTLLYTARSDADPIVRACLSSTSVTALSLAFDCAEQGSELAPELRDRLDDLLASDTDPERRRLVAGVLLTRHLHQFVRTGNGGRVCARPITTDLYQLYQQDTQGLAPDRRPESESGTGNPITGVRGNDAAAFARWSSGITGNDLVYRLPNLSEINDPALRRAFTRPPPESPPHSVWLESDHDNIPPELWIPSGTDHPHLIDVATLTSHVKDDIERSTSTLARLLLLRSIIIRVLIKNRAPFRGLVGDHNRALDLARDLDRDLDLDLTRVRSRALDRALDLDLDLTRVRSRALDRALDLDRAPIRVRALDRDLDRARHVDGGPALARVRALARDLDRALDRVRILDLILDRSLSGGREDVHAQVMGNALVGALTHTLYRTSATTWPAEFVRKFIDVTGLAKADYVVSPDTLADKVHSGHDALVNLLGSPNGVTSLPWAHQVAINLKETALPIFNQQQRLSMDTVTAIRIAALCLAAEADTRQANKLGDTFREIAAGVTLLERRTTGQAVPTETIMLAIT